MTGDGFISIVDDIERKQDITREQLEGLLAGHEADELRQRAVAVRQQVYGKDVYVRGLIEFTNYCRNNCFYCGIRKNNKSIARYRIDEAGILL